MPSDTRTNAPEIAAVCDFLSHCVPFDALDPEQLQQMARACRVRYLRGGDSVEVDAEAPGLVLVRSGAVELRDPAGELIDRCGPGDSFGASMPNFSGATAIEDTLLYGFDAARLQSLRRQNRNFGRYFHARQARRLRRGVYARSSNPLLSRSVAELMSTRVVSCDMNTSIRQAAQQMTQECVSSLLVLDQGHLRGILTDRDMRARGMAMGLDGSEPVTQIMSTQSVVVDASALVFDAMMLMSEHRIHHLPVVADGAVVAMLTTTDLMRAERSDPVFVIHEIGRARTVSELESVPMALRELLRHWVAGGASGAEISRMLTSVSDAVLRKLVVLAEAELGCAPVAWAWLGFGSQARREQALGADQDNALLLDNRYEEAEHGAWFAAFAEFVCDGLARCGYRRCPGDIMASNPRWRQRAESWSQLFRRWIEQPTSDALMHASIFFDLRCIAGDAALVGSLQEEILVQTRQNSIFIACLCENVLKHTPPLGFFRQFLLEKSGEHRAMFDLKHRGLVPLVDVARLYALASGLAPLNSAERLQAVAAAGGLTLRDTRSLADAQEFIARLRFQNQAAQLTAGAEPDNYLDPATLSALGQAQLRDAFELVRQAQKALALKYGLH